MTTPEAEFPCRNGGESASHDRRVTAVGSDHAQIAYDALAPHYDAFTAHHDYDQWTTTLERLAHARGLRGRRMLDVACGTGKSFLPFLERGYDVTACDVSEAMLRLAALKAGDRARLEVHDMRALPTLGSFDFVCCLDDAVNYLLDTDELTAALASLRRNLAPGGVVVFDVNTLRAYRTFFASTTVVPDSRHVLIMDGHATPTFRAGGIAQSTFELLCCGAEGTWRRRRSVHYQRHHPQPVIQAALHDAGLRPVGLYGMQLDGSVTEGFDETENSKAVYIARHRAHERGRR
jgi:SAM-dependent methyltransferase